MAYDRQIREVVAEASHIASEKGFWEGVDVDESFPQCIALIHSELSEALEAHRQGNYIENDGVGEELADVVIRVFDLADKLDQKHGVDIVAEIDMKMRKNRNRKYKHGKRY